MRTHNDLFWTKGDYIYVTSENNRFYQVVMQCFKSDAHHASFFPMGDITPQGADIIFLGQYQQSIDNIGIRITQEKNPEYFL